MYYMDQCNGVTRKHTRCKFMGRYTQDAYGVDLRVCKHHLPHNCIYEWSMHRSLTETPVIILNYLRMFNRIMKDDDMSIPFALSICAKLHNLADLKMPTDFLIDMFHDMVLTKHEDTECPICLTDVSNAVSLDCKHGFCEDCIHKWIYENPTCPMCRERV
jgi:hypothetical protein